MFCDFCDCQGCQKGIMPYDWHAQTSDGKWICDVCYQYEVCQTFPERKGKGPCLGEERKNCTHRPKLVGDWIQNQQ